MPGFDYSNAGLGMRTDSRVAAAEAAVATAQVTAQGYERAGGDNPVVPAMVGMGHDGYGYDFSAAREAMRTESKVEAIEAAVARAQVQSAEHPSLPRPSTAVG